MKRAAKFGPRYGMKRFDQGGPMPPMMPPKRRLPPDAPSDPSLDLPPRGNLPDRSVIPPGRGFGDDIPRKKPPKKPKTMRKGGSVSSASKRADGCAVKGKTRGKFV